MKGNGLLLGLGLSSELMRPCPFALSACPVSLPRQHEIVYLS